MREKEKILNLILEDTQESVFLDETNYYYNDKGIKVCKTCNTPKEIYIDLDGEKVKTRVMCECEREKALKEEKAKEENNRMLSIEEFKNENIRPYKNFTFKHAYDEMPIEIKKYCDNFDKMKESNYGLMIFGGTGNGKTYMAGCIANELIEKGFKVVMANILDCLEYVQDNFDKTGNKSKFLEKLRTYDLVIIDDFGMESNSDFELKNVSRIINTRYESGLPLIITTNITRNEMLDNGLKIQQKRIYSRIVEMTYAIEIKTNDLRYNHGKNTRLKMRKILNGD